MLRREVQYRLFLVVIFLISFFLSAWKVPAFSSPPVDGSLKWKYQTGGPVKSSPAIGSDGTIYVGSDDGSLYAINPDGSLKWKYQTGDWVLSSPAIGSDGTIYVGFYDGSLYAIYSDSHGLANSPWPMFHHDTMHTGRVSKSVPIPTPTPDVTITSFTAEPSYGVAPLNVTLTCKLEGNVTNDVFVEIWSGARAEPEYSVYPNDINTTVISYNATYDSAGIYTPKCVVYQYVSPEETKVLDEVTAKVTVSFLQNVQNFKPLMNPLKVTYNALDNPKYLYLYSLLKLKEPAFIGEEGDSSISNLIEVSANGEKISNVASEIYKKIDDKTYIIRTQVPFNPNINSYTVTLYDVDRETGFPYDVNLNYDKLCIQEYADFGASFNGKLSIGPKVKLKAVLLGTKINALAGIDASVSGNLDKRIFVADTNYCSDSDYSIALGFKESLSGKASIEASLLSAETIITGDFFKAEFSVLKTQVEAKKNSYRVSYLKKFTQDEESEISLWLFPITIYAINPLSYPVDKIQELMDKKLGIQTHYKVCSGTETGFATNVSTIQGGISVVAVTEPEGETEPSTKGNPREIKVYYLKDIIKFSGPAANLTLGIGSEVCYINDSSLEYVYKKESNISSKATFLNVNLMGYDIANWFYTTGNSIGMGFEKEENSNYYKLFYSSAIKNEERKIAFDMTNEEFENLFPNEWLSFSQKTFQMFFDSEKPRISSTWTVKKSNSQVSLVGLEIQGGLGIGGEIVLNSDEKLSIPSTPYISYLKQLLPIYEKDSNTGGSNINTTEGSYTFHILKESAAKNWDNIADEITSLAEKALLGVKTVIKKVGETTEYIYENGKKAISFFGKEVIPSAFIPPTPITTFRSSQETTIIPLVYSHNLKFLSPVMVLNSEEAGNEKVTTVLYPTEENAELIRKGGVFTFIEGKWIPVNFELTEDNGFKFEASIPGIYALILPFPDDEGFLPQIVTLNPGEEKTVKSFEIKMSDGSKAENQEFQLELVRGFAIENGTTTFGDCPVTFPSTVTTDGNGRLEIPLSSVNSKEGECFIKVSSKSGYAQQIVRVIVSQTIKADPEFFLGIKLIKPESGTPKVGDKITLKALSPYEPKEINWTIKDSSDNEVATGNSTEVTFTASKSDIYKVYCYASDKNGVLRTAYAEIPVSDPDNDTDGDGISDNIEKYLGTNPEKDDAEELLQKVSEQSDSIIKITKGEGYIISSQPIPLNKLENIPAGIEPKYALSFRIGGLKKGAQITLEVITPLEEGKNYRVFKIKDGKWIDITKDVEINGNVLTYSITDGGNLDDDNTQNGQIEDPIVIATPVTNSNESNSSSSSGGGGCSLSPSLNKSTGLINLLTMMAGTLPLALGMRKRRKKSR